MLRSVKLAKIAEYRAAIERTIGGVELMIEDTDTGKKYRVGADRESHLQSNELKDAVGRLLHELYTLTDLQADMLHESESIGSGLMTDMVSDMELDAAEATGTTGTEGDK